MEPHVTLHLQRQVAMVSTETASENSVHAIYGESG